MTKLILVICSVMLIATIAPPPAATLSQDHEYHFKNWLISATDFSSLKKLKMSIDDCDFEKTISCAADPDKPKPQTSIEASGVYISHCGDRAKVLAATQPCYPKIAKAANATGVVSVMVVVDEKGEVIWARPVSGHPLLWAAAVKASCQWRFEKNKLCPRVNRMIDFNFQIE